MTNIDPDTAWAAFLRRDRSFDGQFVGAVKTTRIYCKPSCPVRHPLQKNVVFYASNEEAKAAGFRAERAAKALASGGRITDAIYDAGYSTPSRFYADMKGTLGMTPSAWKNGGAGAVIRYAVVDTSLGQMLVAATDKGICRLSFDEDEAALKQRFPAATIEPGGAAMDDLVKGAVAAVERPSAMPDLPLDVAGTEFQQAVWAELRRIPAGETRSYADIAAAIGKPKAVRAAGSANGANNVAVLIPCHRVVRSDGALGGYAYGLAIKRELLRREQIAMCAEGQLL
jgi:AraC family transcriptional regulator, regulatory protein of adaptative response / methylated-DNA-[protein]-cysteine methyltransferase